MSKVIAPALLVGPKTIQCNKCGEEFPERTGFPGLEICPACDALGAAGILKRGEIKVTAAVK